MKQFTLTALVSQDKRLVGVFRVLQHCPALDGEALQNALSKFIEQPYQNIVRKQNDVIYLDDELASKVFEIEVVTFAIWRAAVALRHSKALEVSEIKHGSNWLIQPAEEPYLVKFVLEDQGHNYIILNALPVLGPSVVIKDSGWLHNNVEPQTAVLPDTVLEPVRVNSVGEAMKMKNGLEFSQEDPGPTEILAAFKKGYLEGAKSTALDSGMFEKPVAESFAEGLGEIHDRMLESRSASKALLGEEQESFLAEAALRGQTVVRIPVEESDVVEHLTNKEVDNVPTTHTELGDPALEI